MSVHEGAVSRYYETKRQQYLDSLPERRDFAEKRQAGKETDVKEKKGKLASHLTEYTVNSLLSGTFFHRHPMLVQAVFQSFCCNSPSHKTDNSHFEIMNRHFKIMKRHLKSAFLVKASSKQKCR